jgi:hypothetical protein
VSQVSEAEVDIWGSWWGMAFECVYVYVCVSMCIWLLHSGCASHSTAKDEKY